MTHFKHSHSPSSILVIGASGRLGVEIVRQLAAQHGSKPQVHAFCRDPSKLSNKDRDLCTSVVQGNARRREDIEMALGQTRADFVISAIGHGDDKMRKSDLCTVSAQALAGAMQKPEYNYVRAVVVSRNGAGGSRIILGFGMGTLYRCMLWNSIKDYTRAEEALKSVMDRTDIVRPTGLTDDKATGKLYEFGDRDWVPNLSCDRKDVATWIVKDLHRHRFGGKVISIATKRIR